MMTFSNTFFLEVIFHTRKEEQSHHKLLVCHSSRKQAASLEAGKPDSQQGARDRQGPVLLKPDSNSRLHSALPRCLPTAQAGPCQTSSGNLISDELSTCHLLYQDLLDPISRPFGRHTSLGHLP